MYKLKGNDDDRMSAQDVNREEIRSTESGGTGEQETLVRVGVVRGDRWWSNGATEEGGKYRKRRGEGENAACSASAATKMSARQQFWRCEEMKGCEEESMKN